MTFVVDKIKLWNFRSYEDFETDLSPRLTVVVGPNAAGKTNLIEAIQLLTAGDSFRRPRWVETVRLGADTAALKLHAGQEDDSLEVSLEITETGRSYTINGKKRRGTSALTGKVPTITFTPDDLFMIKGPAEERRAVIDEVGDQLSATYADLRKSYGRVLRQRNAALKAEAGEEELAALDAMLCAHGARLTLHRSRLCGRIAERAALSYADLTGGEAMTASLKSGIAGVDVGQAAGLQEEAISEAFQEALRRARREERARKTSTVGPHRDDVVFLVNGQSARTVASQGQQRSIALAWKLAEVGIAEEVLGRKPVLLLDDVMSELDEARRSALTELILEGPQTVITTTNTHYFENRVLALASIIEMKR